MQQDRRGSVNQRPRKRICVRSHDYRGPLPDKGPTPATTIEKVQQEKLKEVKARLNFKGCSRRNSKVQEVSQHSESGTPNVRGEHRRGQRTERSRSVPGGKEEEAEEYSIGWEIKERVCPHTRKAVTRVTARKEQNLFPENVTMKEHVHGGQKCSLKVKVAEGDTGSENQKSKGQASRMTTYHNHGCVRK
ncbi:hypothetical protein Tco_0001120 [Tanacetum coccineum]